MHAVITEVPMAYCEEQFFFCRQQQRSMLSDFNRYKPICNEVQHTVKRPSESSFFQTCTSVSLHNCLKKFALMWFTLSKHRQSKFLRLDLEF